MFKVHGHMMAKGRRKKTNLKVFGLQERRPGIEEQNHPILSLYPPTNSYIPVKTSVAQDLRLLSMDAELPPAGGTDRYYDLWRSALAILSHSL